MPTFPAAVVIITALLRLLQTAKIARADGNASQITKLFIYQIVTLELESFIERFSTIAKIITIKLLEKSGFSFGA